MERAEALGGFARRIIDGRIGARSCRETTFITLMRPANGSAIVRNTYALKGSSLQYLRVDPVAGHLGCRQNRIPPRGSRDSARIRRCGPAGSRARRDVCCRNGVNRAELALGDRPGEVRDHVLFFGSVPSSKYFSIRASSDSATSSIRRSRVDSKRRLAFFGDRYLLCLAVVVELVSLLMDDIHDAAEIVLRSRSAA